MKRKSRYNFLFFFSFAATLHGRELTASENNCSSDRETGLWFSFLLALLAAVYFFYRYRRLKAEQQRIQLRNSVLETDLEVNRTLINPHFFFNSFSALQNFILNHEHSKANDYLVKLSKLTRSLLVGNVSNTTSVEQELSLVKNYLQFRSLNFEGPLQYFVESDPAIASETYIPVMMVMPFVENALWHGLQKKSGDKTIRVTFSRIEHLYVVCVIDDNGIGRKKTAQAGPIKKMSSIAFVMKRLALLNKVHRLDCTLTLEDKPLDQGTTVKIRLPILKQIT